MLVQGYEVSYEIYQNINNKSKSNLVPLCHIDEIVKGNTILDDEVKVTLQSGSRIVGSLRQFVASTLSGRISASNPSILKNWRGWNYIPKYPIVRITTNGLIRQNYFRPILKIDNKHLMAELTNIPWFLKNSLESEVIYHGYTDDEGSRFTINLTLHSTKGVICLQYKVFEHKGTIIPVLDKLNMNYYKAPIITWKEVQETNLVPKAPDNKYYEVEWCKSIDDENIIEKNNNFYIKGKKITYDAQIVTEAYPKFLGNVSKQLKNTVYGWYFVTNHNKQPQLATNYKGFWVKLKSGDFSYLSINSLTFQDCIVVNKDGKPLSTLRKYYNYITSKDANYE